MKHFMTRTDCSITFSPKGSIYLNACVRPTVVPKKRKRRSIFFGALEEREEEEEEEEDEGEKTILKADKSNIVHSIYGLSSSLRQSVPNLFIRL